MEKSKTALADVLEKSMIAADRLEHKNLIFTYRGTVYPTTLCTPEIFKAMESSEARRDDVILASFPKLLCFSCCTKEVAKIMLIIRKGVTIVIIITALKPTVIAIATTNVIMVLYLEL